MVMPTAEFREQMVAGGCDEKLADILLDVAAAMHDAAVEEAVAKAMEQIAHSAGLLNGRIDGHDAKNEGQFRAIESTIREIAAEIRVEIAGLRTAIERGFTDLQTEFERGFTSLETGLKCGFSFSGMQLQIARLESQIAAFQAEANANCEQLQATINRAAFGLAALMIALTGMVLGLLAATGAFS